MTMHIFLQMYFWNGSVSCSKRWEFFWVFSFSFLNQIIFHNFFHSIPQSQELYLFQLIHIVFSLLMLDSYSVKKMSPRSVNEWSVQLSLRFQKQNVNQYFEQCSFVCGKTTTEAQFTCTSKLHSVWYIKSITHCMTVIFHP